MTGQAATVGMVDGAVPRFDLADPYLATDFADQNALLALFQNKRLFASAKFDVFIVLSTFPIKESLAKDSSFKRSSSKSS